LSLVFTFLRPPEKLSIEESKLPRPPPLLAGGGGDEAVGGGGGGGAEAGGGGGGGGDVAETCGGGAEDEVAVGAFAGALAVIPEEEDFPAGGLLSVGTCDEEDEDEAATEVEGPSPVGDRSWEVLFEATWVLEVDFLATFLAIAPGGWAWPRRGELGGLDECFLACSIKLAQSFFETSTISTNLAVFLNVPAGTSGSLTVAK